jgi:hypothetical protein
MLHAVKLVSSFAPRVLGKSAEILQGASPELEVFHRGFLRRVRHD